MISSFDLQLGDDDATRRWGGEVRPVSLTNSDVADFKIMLVACGLLEAAQVGVAGRFDQATRTAVLRLQWYVENVPGFIGPGGNFISWTASVCTIRDGIANSFVRSTVAEWRRLGYSAAGNLLRGRFDDYADIVAGAGFSELLGAGVFLVDRGFLSALATAQALASANGLRVHANQIFRVEGAVVSGAVVTPAGFSAHKLGRAIDLNAAVGLGAPQASSAMRAASPVTPLGRFRDGMKRDGGCRYGGDFATSDPPHFDRQVMPSGSFEWKCMFYFNQRQYGLARINAEAIPLAGGA